MRLPRNRGSSRFNRGTEWARGLVMRAGRILATYSGSPPRWWLLRAASREFHRESDKRAGRRRISTRTHQAAVPLASYTADKPECREHIWESPKLLRQASQAHATSRHSIKGLQRSATRRKTSLSSNSVLACSKPFWVPLLYKRARPHQNWPSGQWFFGPRAP